MSTVLVKTDSIWPDMSLSGSEIFAPKKDDVPESNLRKKVDVTEIGDNSIINTSWISPELYLANAPKNFAVPRKSSLVALAEWEGCVDKIEEDRFTAKLTEISKSNLSDIPDMYDSEGDFLIEDLSDSDIGLLKKGAIFRWVVGYSRTVSGTKRRVSQIIMRRLPAWTKKDSDYADLEGERLSRSISQEHNQ